MTGNTNNITEKSVTSPHPLSTLPAILVGISEQYSQAETYATSLHQEALYGASPA
jgi:hypothetical protein